MNMIEVNRNVILNILVSRQICRRKKTVTYLKLAMHEEVQNVAKIKPAQFQCQMHFESQIFILCNSRIAFRSFQWIVISRLSKKWPQIYILLISNYTIYNTPNYVCKRTFSLLVFCYCCLLRILLLICYKYEFSIKMCRNKYILREKKFVANGLS